MVKKFSGFSLAPSAAAITKVERVPACALPSYLRVKSLRSKTESVTII